tara:strand:- start:1005 stop:2294 length:1290 start_codon:yes stop_codon:yes gene_type:complete
MKKLKNLILTKKAKICIIGLGYVGLPLAVKLAKKGFKVYGFDNDEKKIQNLENNNIYVDTIERKDFKKVKNKKFIFGNIKDKLNHYDIFIICVPTPLKKNKSPEMKYLLQSKQMLSNVDLKNKAIILESTTYPGTTEELYIPLIKKKKLNLGKNVFLIYSPERIDPGNKKFNVTNTTKVISGATKSCLKLAEEFYKNVTKTYSVSSLKTAEFTKLLENIYRSINIGFVNEMKIVSDKLKVDIYEAIKAASTKPFGFVPFFPGPGLGGHCIPIDPFLLSWKAKKIKTNTRFIKLSGNINNYMPRYAVSKFKKLFVSNKKKIKNSKILILGVSYKKDSADTRETPSIKIINLLKNLGCNVDVSDKYCSNSYLIKHKLKNVIANYKNIKKYDCIFIVTDHSYFNYRMIEKYSKSIVDCRGKIKTVSNKKIRA